MPVKIKAGADTDKLSVLAWPKEKNLDSNPYNYILYRAMPDNLQVTEFNSRKMKLNGEQILHIHWPDMLLRGRRTWRIKFRFRRLVKTVAALKRRGGKLVWTVHNLKPHNPVHAELAGRLMAEFVHLVDGFLFLSEPSREQFLASYPEQKNKPFCISPHVHYRHYYASTTPVITRSTLDIPEEGTVLLMFGKLRFHKGLENLLQAQESEPIENLYTVIAGSPGDDEAAKALQGRIGGTSNYRMQLTHVASERVPDYFALADAVVLPYVNILNSGTAILALSFGVPIIAPAMGSFNSLKEQVGHHMVFLYSGQLDRQVFDDALAWLAENKSSVAAFDGSSLAIMEPKVVAQSTADFYQQLLVE